MEEKVVEVEGGNSYEKADFYTTIKMCIPITNMKKTKSMFKSIKYAVCS